MMCEPTCYRAPDPAGVSDSCFPAGTNGHDHSQDGGQKESASPADMRIGDEPTQTSQLTAWERELGHPQQLGLPETRSGDKRDGV